MTYVTLEKDPLIKVPNKIEYFYDPKYIYIPINNPANFRLGSLVLKDMPICHNYSSISGIIQKIDEHYLMISNDYREKCVRVKKINNKIDLYSLNKALSIYDHDLFLKFKSLKKIDNIVINAIDDELYVANNILNFKENINDVLEILDKLIYLYKAKKTLIVIKNTESDLIDECLDLIGTYPSIKLTLLENYYLLERKDIILNKLKIDENKTLYLSMNELVKIEKIVKYNMVDSTFLLTICGDVLKENKVIMTKRYVSLKELVSKYLEIIDNNYVIIVNSLINGYEASLNLILTDDIKVIYFMKKKKARESKCIRCGKCLEVCPKHIDILNGSDYEECISCGLCNYVCPSFINILSRIKKDGEEK